MQVLSSEVYVLISPGARILPAEGFLVGLAEGRGLHLQPWGGPFMSDLMLLLFPSRRGEKTLMHIGVCMLGKNTKPQHGPLLNLSAERNQGCPEIENVAEN